ncbi:MAG TPA: FAD-dependent oxidoreductase, partial [Longimicrobiales bacterium]
MTLSGRPDVIVVGAGIIGAACALELARAGARVLVLDAAAAGGGTTAAAMGHLVVMDDSEAQLALTAYSLGLWRALAPELPAQCELDPCGTLWIAADEGQLEALHAKQAYYSSHGVTAEVLDASALATLEPGLRAPLAGALLVPGDSVVYPPGAAKYLLDEACRAGATFLGGTAVQRVLTGAVLVSG